MPGFARRARAIPTPLGLPGARGTTLILPLQTKHCPVAQAQLAPILRQKSVAEATVGRHPPGGPAYPTTFLAEVSMSDSAQLAIVAALLGDPARANIMTA